MELSGHHMTFDHDVAKSKLADNSSTKTGLAGYVSLYSDRSDLDQLSVRCRTYLLWPGWAPRSVEPVRLAEAGLYFTGEDDAVRCYSCRETFSGWKDGDDPLDVHRRRRPTCPVVLAVSRRRPPSSPPCSAVKLSDDVVVDGEPTCKTSAEDRIDVDTRPTDHIIRSRGTVVSTTTNLPKPDKAKLKEENRRLRAELMCRRCQLVKVETLFLPCRHLVACQQCADVMDDCVRCGRKILGTVRTYLL